MRFTGVKPSRSRYAGVALILAIGILHLVVVRDYYEQSALYGALLVLFFALCLVSGAGILLGRRGLGWLLGAALAAGAFALYVYSRIEGIPDLAEAEGEWGWLGALALILEVLFVALCAAVIGKRRTRVRT